VKLFHDALECSDALVLSSDFGSDDCHLDELHLGSEENITHHPARIAAAFFNSICNAITAGAKMRETTARIILTGIVKILRIQQKF